MKKQLGPQPLLFPMPALLVGTCNDDGSANAMTAAWAAVCCHRPLCMGISVRHNRLTFANLQKQKAFTLNIPRASQAAAVDYLGMISGADQPHKLDRVGFKSEDAQQVTAPIIVDCPINIECRLVDRMSLGSHSWFAGEVVEVHVDAEYQLTSGEIDVTRLDPLVYATSSARYHHLGPSIAAAYSVGKTFMKE